ncbi:transcription regulator gal80 [Colletotrichum sp. CLE4]
MAPQVTNVGFIGLSSRPEWSWAVAAHLPYFTHSKTYNLAALQNSSKETAQKAIHFHSLSQNTKAYGEIDALVADPDVELVAVTIKVHLHATAVEAAIRAGKRAVFCESPLARNSAEAEHLTSLAKERNVRTLVGLQGRQNPATLKARELVEQRGAGGHSANDDIVYEPLVRGYVPRDGGIRRRYLEWCESGVHLGWPRSGRAVFCSRRVEGNTGYLGE